MACWNTNYWPHSQSFRFSKSGVGLRICILMSSWAHADAAGSRNHTLKVNHRQKWSGSFLLFIEFLLFSCLVMSNSGTPWNACQISLSFTNSCSLLKLLSVELVMLSNHLILCGPLLLLPLIFPSIYVFSNKSALHQVAKVSELQLQIRYSSEYSSSELISFRIDWLDLLAAWGTLKIYNTTVWKHQFFVI